MLMNYYEYTDLGEYYTSYYVPEDLVKKYNLEFDVKYKEKGLDFYVLEFFDVDKEDLNQLKYVPIITEEDLIFYLNFFNYKKEG